METASVAAVGHAHEHEHHGPPEANQSSRIDRQTLGILLFIVSEVDAVRGVLRLLLLPPRRRQRRALAAATASSCRSPSPASTRAILVSSSFTMHWALESIRAGNRRGLQMGLVADLPARRHLPLHPDQRVRPHRLQRPRRRLRLDLLRPHRPARRPRLRRPLPAQRSPTSAPSAATSAPTPRTTWASRCPGSTGTSSTSCGSSSSRPSTSSSAGCKSAPGGVLGRSRAEHATLPASYPGLIFAASG